MSQTQSPRTSPTDPVGGSQLPVALVDPQATLPERTHPGDAGLDLHSVQRLTIPPRQRALVRTGLAVAIPDGHVGLVCPRSGLARERGIGLVNAPGVVDAGYRGELCVVLGNSDETEPFEIEVGDRIAQLVIVPVWLGEVAQIEQLEDATSRGTQGFGSSGLSARRNGDR